VQSRSDIDSLPPTDRLVQVLQERGTEAIQQFIWPGALDWLTHLLVRQVPVVGWIYTLMKVFADNLKLVNTSLDKISDALQAASEGDASLVEARVKDWLEAGLRMYLPQVLDTILRAFSLDRALMSLQTKIAWAVNQAMTWGVRFVKNPIASALTAIIAVGLGVIVRSGSVNCVHNRSTFISYEEEDNWGTTHDTSEHYFGRPKGAHALIKESMLGTGSPAADYLIPPGWNELPALNRARGHLLGRQLGGSGTNPRNIVALYQVTANNPAMRDCENKIAQAVRNGECVEIWIRAAYNSTDPKPTRVFIRAMGDRGHFSLSVQIPNTPFAPTPNSCR
jgi:hypothetical protein